MKKFLSVLLCLSMLSGLLTACHTGDEPVEPDASATAGTDALTIEGMTVAEIPDVYQQMCDLPHGLYISHVTPGSHAQQQGITAGDVLIGFAGKPVSQLADLQGVLENRHVETADLTICRNGTEQTITIILTGE